MAIRCFAPRDHLPEDDKRPSHQKHVKRWQASKKWQDYQVWFWNQAKNTTCALCGCDLLTLPHNSRHIDHITPHRGVAALFWAAANTQALCLSCHSKKTLNEGSFTGYWPSPPEK